MNRCKLRPLLATALSLVCGLIFCGAAKADSSDPIRFFWLESWTMPFANDADLKAGGTFGRQGIKGDWEDALAKDLGRPRTRVFYPHNRQDEPLFQQQIDLFCFVNPDWLSPATVQKYLWPSAFLTVEERLVGHLDSPMINVTEDMENHRIGTTLGYVYPSLNGLFARHFMIREDAPSEQAVINKFFLHRSEYMVMRTLDYDYYRAHDNRFIETIISPFVVSRSLLYCAASKDGTVSLKQLTESQGRLLKAGVLDKIIKSYQ